MDVNLNLNATWTLTVTVRGWGGLRFWVWQLDPRSTLPGHDKVIDNVSR